MPTASINIKPQKPERVVDAEKFIRELRDFLRSRNVDMLHGDWDAGDLSFLLRIDENSEVYLTVGTSFLKEPSVTFCVVEYPDGRNPTSGKVVF